MKLTKVEEKLLKKYVNQVVTLKGINDIGQKFEVKGTLNGIYDNYISIKQVFKNIKDKKVECRKKSIYNINAYYEFEYYKFMFLELLDDKNNLIFENQNKKEIFKRARKNCIKHVNKNIENGKDIFVYDPVTEKLKNMIGMPIVLDGIRKFYAIEEKLHDSGLFYKLVEQDNIDTTCMLLKKGKNFSKGIDFHFVSQKTSLKKILPDGEVELVEDNKKYDLKEFWEKRKDKSKNNDDDWWLEK